MVFSSIPLYLDPHNWHQQQNHGVSGANPQLQVSPPQMGGGENSIRPGSMADRARLAKLPQPEPGLKCPRCDSTNTKFCYFNNYNLTQPRHFCKTCRRYWTRGGALRTVPVGGGCRKNKRAGKNISKSCTTPSSSTEVNIIPNHNFSQMPILPSLENLGSGCTTTNTPNFCARNLGLNFVRTQQESDQLGFIQLENNNINPNDRNNSTILSDDQWRNSQHFPFLNNTFETNASSNYYQLFQNQVQNVVEAPSYNIPLVGSMKMEDQNPLGIGLTRPLLGNSLNFNQYWGNNNNNNNGENTWSTDFSDMGLNSSSSTSHLL